MPRHLKNSSKNPTNVYAKNYGPIAAEKNPLSRFLGTHNLT